jgi:hypothetical protein
MALILPGKSTCAACGETIQTGEEATGLPHFATGPEDIHWRFSDAPFHLACYVELPERAAIEARVDEMRARSAERKRATEKALLDAWRNAEEFEHVRVPRESDWMDEFEWAGLARRDNVGWRFTKFGEEHARALDAADSGRDVRPRAS